MDQLWVSTSYVPQITFPEYKGLHESYNINFRTEKFTRLCIQTSNISYLVTYLFYSEPMTAI
jgi:hypothetical protein